MRKNEESITERVGKSKTPYLWKNHTARKIKKIPLAIPTMEAPVGKVLSNATSNSIVPVVRTFLPDSEDGSSSGSRRICGKNKLPERSSNPGETILNEIHDSVIGTKKGG